MYFFVISQIFLHQLFSNNRMFSIDVDAKTKICGEILLIFFYILLDISRPNNVTHNLMDS